MSDPIPISLKEQTEWFHGSPQKLHTLLTGSTITPVKTLARAFSHKPEILSFEVAEKSSIGKRCCTIKHDGVKHGYLYRVMVEDPSIDIIQHPESNAAQGDEMLTTRPLKLEFLEELPLQQEYEYQEDM